MKITKRKLQSMGACAEHVALFEATFPHGTYVTLESIDEAREVGLDIDWFADHVPEDRREEYERIERPAWAEYEHIRQLAWQARRRAAQPEYERIWRSAWAAYKKARDAALVAAYAD